MSSYDDIINRLYRGATSMKKMPLEARAAQFAPFAALTSHNAAIHETARITSKTIELSPDEQLNLSQRLNLAIHLIDRKPELTITFFIHDSAKPGGSYVKATGYLKKYLEYDNTIILSDDSIINVQNIIAIDGEIFDSSFLL